MEQRVIKVNLQPKYSMPQAVNVSQYDVGVVLKFELYDGMSVADLTGCTAKIHGTRPSGVGFSVTGTISNNTVTVSTVTAMTGEHGRFPAEIELTKTGVVVGTANFVMAVEKSPHPDGTIDSDIIAQESLLERVEALEDADTDLRSDIGDLEDLETEDKSSLVNAINEARGSGGSGLTADIKTALLQIAQKVAYIDEDGQDYYDDLYDALYAITAITLNTNSVTINTIGGTSQLTATTTPEGGSVSWSSSNTSVATVSSTGLVTSVAYGSATITATAGNVSATCSVLVATATCTGITATYTQSGTVYDTATLDSLKSDLVVTASWSDSTTTTLEATDYTLTGTLSEGTSLVTVSYGGQTDTFNVTVTADPYQLLYTLTDSDMTITGNFATSASSDHTYVGTGNTRVSYLPFDLTIDKNRSYKVVAEPSDMMMQIQLCKNGAIAQSATGESISNYITGSGWVANGYVFDNDGFAKVNRYEGLRVQARTAENGTITFDDFDYIKIYQTANRVDGDLHWELGYISGTPEFNSSHTNGEMYTSIPVPVTAGHTYRLANSNAEWNSAWKAWFFADSDFATFSSRQTHTSSSTYLDITVPEGYSYICVCSRNLENYYETATFTDITE